MKHKGFLTYDIRDIRELGTIEECTEKGYFWYWDEAKVGRAFNFGHGRTPMEYSNVIKDQKYDECLIMPCRKMTGNHGKTDLAAIHKRAENA